MYVCVCCIKCVFVCQKWCVFVCLCFAFVCCVWCVYRVYICGANEWDYVCETLNVSVLPAQTVRSTYWRFKGRKAVDNSAITESGASSAYTPSRQPLPTMPTQNTQGHAPYFPLICFSHRDDPGITSAWGPREAAAGRTVLMTESPAKSLKVTETPSRWGDLD